MAFEKLIGQDFARRVLMNELGSDRVASTYLFFGPTGCGKKTAALDFATELLAGKDASDESRRTIARRIETGNHSDFRLWEPSGASFKVDQVRELVRECSMKANEGSRRVFILDRIEVLTDSAGNALLKTLEEPAEGNVFILVTTQRAKVMPTIASRSQAVRFSPLGEKELLNVLERRHQLALEKAERLKKPLPVFDKAAAGEAARLSGGSVSRAESHLGDEGRQLRELAEGYFEALHQNHVLARLAWAHAAAVDKAQVPELLDLVGVYARDLWARRQGLGESTMLLHKAPSHGGSLSPQRLEQVLDALARARTALARNAGLPLSMEVLSLAAPDMRPGEAQIA